MSSFFSRLSAVILMLTFAGVTTCSAEERASSTVPNPAIDTPIATTKSEQTAVVAGGCFWGIQAVFQHVKGVINATSGYAGGAAKTAEYEVVSTGETGHAESVKITLRSITDHVRPTASGLLLRCPRPHAVEPARPRRGYPVSVFHFLRQ
jgi:Peptide methionine sulfoxide reductase